MFKGHTKIELTDVNTGEVQVHEEDNMFTDAIYQSLNNTWTALVGGVSTLKSWHLPLSQKMLGGVALFEDAIEESETVDYFPAGNRIIGLAGTLASDGTKPWWGSRNSLESEAYDNETRSVKHVWDFTTSQANGRISAVGIVDGRQANYYGDSAWNMGYTRRVEVTSYFSSYGKRIVEFVGNTFTAMTNQTGQVTIIKIRFNFDTVSLNNNLGTTEVISEKVVMLPMAGQSYNCCYWKDGGDGYWYGFICTNNSFSSPWQTSENSDYYCSKYLQVIRINKETYGMEYHNITLPYCMSPRNANPIITNNYIGFLCCKNEYWYWHNANYIPHTLILNKICLISKFDWTASMKDLKDEQDRAYSCYKTSYNNAQHSAAAYMPVCGLKLPNGTYQMNEFIFDDDFVILKQLCYPIDTTTGMPDTNMSSSNGKITNLRYNNFSSIGSNSSAYRYMSWFTVINKEKSVIIFGEYNYDDYHVWMVPCDCQKLMTINNLSEPVTKTSTQTMKVTYTITDVDE